MLATFKQLKAAWLNLQTIPWMLAEIGELHTRIDRLQKELTALPTPRMTYVDAQGRHLTPPKKKKPNRS